jgi:hypothetical protein
MGQTHSPGSGHSLWGPLFFRGISVRTLVYFVICVILYGSMYMGQGLQHQTVQGNKILGYSGCGVTSGSGE